MASEKNEYDHPPSYATFEDRIAQKKRATEQIETQWESCRPADWKTKGWNICFHLNPGIGQQIAIPWSVKRLLRRGKAKQRWEAKLYVWAKSIPRLMLDGFVIGSGNEIVTQGNISLNVDKAKEGHTAFHTRTYEFESTRSRYKDMALSDWKARLELKSTDAAVVTGFDLDWLHHDNVVKVEAWNWQREHIYGYQKGVGDRCFNTIYGTMPLQGLWPWPRTAEESAKLDNKVLKAVLDA